jgi:hypothetical protein
MGERVIYGSFEAENVFSKELVDIDNDIVGGLDEYSNCSLCLSSNTIAEMKAYMKSHNGDLPSELKG